jgi:hypothetical protein
LLCKVSRSGHPILTLVSLTKKSIAGSGKTLVTWLCNEMANALQNANGNGDGKVCCTLTSVNGANSNLNAKVELIERWGTVVRIDTADEPLVARNDIVELSVDLPGTGTWTPRTMRCVGNAVQVSRDASGVWWVVVHFRQLQISAHGDGNQTEQSSEEIAGARSRLAAGAGG